MVTTKEINKLIQNVLNDIKEIEKISKDKNINVKINEGLEIEKKIISKYPFMYLSSFNMVNYWGKFDKLAEEINNNENKEEINLLNLIGFSEINKEVVSVKSDYIKIYLLNYTKHFKNLSSDDIIIIKEYKNKRIDFKFKNKNDLVKFKKIVYFENDLTKKIKENLTKSFIKNFKEIQKDKYSNEISLIYDLARKIKPNGILIFNKYPILKEIERNN